MTAAAALKEFNDAIAGGAPMPIGISVWCLDGGPELETFLTETRSWTAP